MTAPSNPPATPARSIACRLGHIHADGRSVRFSSLLLTFKLPTSTPFVSAPKSALCHHTGCESGRTSEGHQLSQDSGLPIYATAAISAGQSDRLQEILK